MDTRKMDDEIVDYFTVSKDNTILNDEPIVNDKPDKVHNRFDKDSFAKFMLIIDLLALFVAATFWCISIMKAYPNQMGSKMVVVAIVLSLLIMLAMIVIDMRMRDL